MSPNWSAIEESITQQTGKSITLKNPLPVSGGCINQAWRVTDQANKNWFIKCNRPSRIAMFEAELLGLQEIIASKTVLVPKPLCAGETAQLSFLVLEYLELSGSPDTMKTGQQLAKMHHYTQKDFGWVRENTIGSTPQINTNEADWITFWQKHRLGFQLDLALQKGLPHRGYTAGQELNEKLGSFFTTYYPAASLLHGDLWGGNCSKDKEGNPVIYDPAVYYGDRETDLAMTELFGGFGQGFIDSYNDYYPIDSGYGVRKNLYNLYHILNHYNLFGGGYGSQATHMIESLLSELQ